MVGKIGGKIMKRTLIIFIFALLVGCNESGDDPKSSSKKKYSPPPEISECHEPVNIEEYETVEPPDNMKVFLLIGQSNAEGHGELLPEDMETFENIYLLLDESNNWVKASNPMSQFSNIRSYEADRLGMSFVYSFAKELIEHYPGQVFGIIANPRGGTSIKQWEKGSVCYECTMDRTLIVPHEIVAVLVHQGESDWNNPNWLNAAGELVEDIRYDTGYQMPFIFGELVVDNVHHINFNKRLHELPDLVNDVRIVSAEGATWFDNRHFDRDGQILLGKRYFKAWAAN